MRLGVLTALTVLSTPALADRTDRLEATGFLGVMDFSETIGLGSSISPEQRPQTAPMFGGRLTYIPLRSHGRLHLELGVEGELSFTPSWTGYGFDGPRDSYFAPVFGYRSSALFRLGGTWLEPHVTAGVGGATVVSKSPYMKKETDGVFVWGLGTTFPMMDRWQLRFDVHQTLMPAMGGGTTASYEAVVAIGGRFGLARAPATAEHVEVANSSTAPPPSEADADTDGDGIPDKLDACPREPETVNGIDDQDGCPEADPDGDHILGAADRCPDQPEDFDNFEDDDGCPDLDNDKDGVADANDKCPTEPETINGIADDDGCPDQVPKSVVTALQSAARVKFEANRPRLSDAAKSALDMALVTLLNNPKLKVTITVHPDRSDDTKASELAKRRAEVVKWYLVEQGIAAAQLTTTVGPVITKKKTPLLEMGVTQ